jgi:bacillithiol biosynthesis deacetylase BshB1
MPCDLLVFGPHPDDIEIGLGGTVAKHAAEGHRVGLCDLSAGELGSNGTPDIRRREAEEATKVLGAAWRENLGWPDGAIANTPILVRSAVEAIRRHRPRAIAAPYWNDRHPDHIGASEALRAAAFASGLRRFAAHGVAWRPDWVCYYFINDSAPASFVVDVSAQYETKRAALACYTSQFSPTESDAVTTRLMAPAFRQLVESRDAQFGALIGAAFAEGLAVHEPVERESLFRKPQPRSEGPGA